MAGTHEQPRPLHVHGRGQLKTLSPPPRSENGEGSVTRLEKIQNASHGRVSNGICHEKEAEENLKIPGKGLQQTR